jgi:uncharacterized membrane-anchored protein
MKTRNLILWLFAFFVLVVVNMLVFQKERLSANGQVVFLELAPVDPRSLIQGDYMRLRYAISREVKNNTGDKDGFIVVLLNKDNIAQYVRIYDAQIPLNQNELLIRFRQRAFDIRIGPESFLLQEGHAKYYNNARFGELRVSKSGDVLLIGLRGEELELLGPP